MIDKQIVTYTELIQIFLNFLKKNYAYKPYMHNLRKDIIEHQLPHYYLIQPFETKRFYLCHKAEDGFKDLINHAFIWSETQEGHAFWRQLHNEWKYEIAPKYQLQ